MAGEGKGASITKASPAAVIKSAQQDYPDANMNTLRRIIYNSPESRGKTTSEATFAPLFGLLLKISLLHHSPKLYEPKYL